MAKSRKPHSPQQPKTGDDFIQQAEKRGAVIHQKDSRGFVRIETPAGSTWITPGKQPLDPRTRKNIRHWFRLLGLMTFLGIALSVIDYLWGILQLPPIF